MTDPQVWVTEEPDWRDPLNVSDMALWAREAHRGDTFIGAMFMIKEDHFGDEESCSMCSPETAVANEIFKATHQRRAKDQARFGVSWDPDIVL